jgi:hypothetical protein
MERFLRPSNPATSERIRALRLETEREFGALTATINRLAGMALLASSRLEAKRYPFGRRREPRTFVERRPAIVTD